LYEAKAKASTLFNPQKNADLGAVRL
jgi:hypothetical protein